MASIRLKLRMSDDIGLQLRLVVLLILPVNGWYERIEPTANIDTDYVSIGRLSIQLPTNYVSDGAFVAYDRFRTPLDFGRQRHKLQISASYAGVQRRYGPIRGGIQMLLEYDIVAPVRTESPERLRLHPSGGPVAPLTTQLLGLLGRWLDSGGGSTRHLVYPLTGATDQSIDSEQKTITNALQLANYWLSILPASTRHELAAVGFPNDIADLVGSYLPSDFYDGFVWYRTATNFRKTGDNSKMKFSVLNHPSMPVPTSITVSFRLSECLNRTDVGKPARPTSNKIEPALVILPTAKLIDFMANSNLPGLVDQVVSMSWIALPNRKLAFVDRLLTADVPAVVWSLNLVSLRILLLSPYDDLSPFYTTDAGRQSIRRFIETVVGPNRPLFVGIAGFAELLFTLTGLTYATRILQPPVEIGRPPSRSAAAAFVNSLCLQSKSDDAYSKDRRRMQKTLLSNLAGFGRSTDDFRTVWLIALSYDTVDADFVDDDGSDRWTGLSMVYGFYGRLFGYADIDDVIKYCNEIVVCRPIGADAAGMIRIGYKRLASEVHPNSLLMTDLAALLAEPSSTLLSLSSSSYDSKEQPIISGIDPDAAPRIKRKPDGTESAAAAADTDATIPTKRPKPNRSD